MGACANINNWCQISAEVPIEDISLKTKSKVGISRDQSKNDIRSEIFFDQNVKQFLNNDIIGRFIILTIERHES